MLPKKKRVEVVWPKTTAAQRQVPEAGDRRRITLTDGERDGELLLGE
jgi:hypothetical protein